MSRHQLPSARPRFEVFVGWDPPLQTYFCQVYDTRRKEEENPILWVGTDKRTSWKEILDTISPYAAVSREMAQTLLDDKRLNR
jgi:hypothetical protein